MHSIDGGLEPKLAAAGVPGLAAALEGKGPCGVFVLGLAGSGKASTIRVRVRVRVRGLAG